MPSNARSRGKVRAQRRGLTLGTAWKVAAIVVTYYPKSSMLKNLRSLSKQIDRVIIIDNTPNNTVRGYFAQAARLPNADIYHLKRNIGIGGALNIGMQLARHYGYSWAFTFDQDSFLAATATRRLRRSARPDTAIVAPLIRSAFDFQPIFRQKDAWFPEKHDVVITSGNLVRIEAWESVGGFDWKLFLDSVDFDFCLRLAKRSWTVVRNNDVHLVHRTGTLRVTRLFPFLVLRTRTYSPLRRYLQARNGVTVLRRYASFSPGWATEFALRLVLMSLKVFFLEKPCRRAWVRGLKHGLNRDHDLASALPWQLTSMQHISARTIQKLAAAHQEKIGIDI